MQPRPFYKNRCTRRLEKPACPCQGLHDAATHGDLDEVVRLLALGVDPNVYCTRTVRWGFTALMEAAECGHPRVCEALLNARACPGIVCHAYSRTALAWVCSFTRASAHQLSHGHVETVDLLLTQCGPRPGSEIDRALDEACFCTTTLPAVQSCVAAIVQRLLQEGGLVRVGTMIDPRIAPLLDKYYEGQRRLAAAALQATLGVHCSPLVPLVLTYLLNARMVVRLQV